MEGNGVDAKLLFLINMNFPYYYNTFTIYLIIIVIIIVFLQED